MPPLEVGAPPKRGPGRPKKVKAAAPESFPPRPPATAPAAGDPFTVQGSGAPILDAAGTSTGAGAPASSPSAPPPPEPAASWSPEAAALAIAAIADGVGVLLAMYYGATPDEYLKFLKAAPAEVKGWDEAAARVFQKLLPQFAGGAGSLGSVGDGVVIAEGAGTMVMRRVGPVRAIRSRKLARKRSEQSGATEAEADAPITRNGRRPPAPAAEPDTGDGAYRLPRDLAAFVDQSSARDNGSEPPPLPI